MRVARWQDNGAAGPRVVPGGQLRRGGKGDYRCRGLGYRFSSSHSKLVSLGDHHFYALGLKLETIHSVKGRVHRTRLATSNCVDELLLWVGQVSNHCRNYWGTLGWGVKDQQTNLVNEPKP